MTPPLSTIVPSKIRVLLPKTDFYHNSSGRAAVPMSNDPIITMFCCLYINKAVITGVCFVEKCALIRELIILAEDRIKDNHG